MKNNTWQLQDAKSKFSQLVEYAIRERPQIVTRHGRNAVVVISYDEYARMIEPEKDLVAFFEASPTWGQELDEPRAKDYPRDLDL